ncbi:hypothetical protein LOTGIDRAFT_175700 [Lottia gigantea]|uniref:Uncharacterized protein n=1 Tax=Lottia gigantea TaxID=225164 RepID=V4BU11_LOTGI|nr:hypothetical protein LOTGIDRAFT_175700 [Lottia gigantea]ESO92469.1 hypothetical protein LOTGIDRAFT_175700 [Lottia gigantea]
MARADCRPIPTIYQEEIIKLRAVEDPNVVKTVPTFYSNHSSSYRARDKELPTLPIRRSDINHPDMYKETNNGEDFLIHQDDDMLILSTTENLQHLSGSEVLFCDGTFSAVPEVFHQLYSVHALVEGKMFPLVYSLLPNKKQSALLHHPPA